jgi:hypothetical protein
MLKRWTRIRARKEGEIFQDSEGNVRALHLGEMSRASRVYHLLLTPR